MTSHARAPTPGPQQLPIVEEYATEFDAVAEYKQKVEELKMPKADFIHQMTAADQSIVPPRR